MPTGPITLEHVAQAAGVSPSTASRALAGKARQCRISEKTEKAVIQAAQGLGFQASHVARSLRSQRTGLIGLMVPDASNPFFAAIARKATIFAERHGLSTLLADSHDSIEHEKDLLTHLLSRQVEGLIVCPIGESSSHLQRLERSGAKVVVVDRWFPDIQLTTVTSENERGAFAATSAIIDQGHRHIGCLQGRPGTSSNDERLHGFNTALQANNIESTATLHPWRRLQRRLRLPLNVRIVGNASGVDRHFCLEQSKRLRALTRIFRTPTEDSARHFPGHV